MLKTSSTNSAKPRKSRVGVGDDSKTGYNRSRLDGSKLDRSKVDGNEVDRGEVKKDEVGKKVQKTSKSKNLSKSKKTIRLGFFILGARLAFTKLRQAFIKTPILYHFDLERYIRIETNISGYSISRVLSQLISKG